MEIKTKLKEEKVTASSSGGSYISQKECEVKNKEKDEEIQNVLKIAINKLLLRMKVELRNYQEKF